MSGDLHGDGLGNTGRDHVARRCAAEIVKCSQVRSEPSALHFGQIILPSSAAT